MEGFIDVPGYEGRYQVSNYGRVRMADGTILKGSLPRNRREYQAVYLRSGTQRKRIAVHRLVALAFIGPPPFPDAQVRHFDGNHLNNRVSNLEWGTAKANAEDRKAHGTTASGERHGLAKLTDAEREAIGTSAERSSVLAQRYGVHRTTIQKIRARAAQSADTVAA